MARVLVALAVGQVTPLAAQTAVRIQRGVITGRVFDRLTGNPIPFALVTFGPKRWFASESGRFAIANVSPGPAVVVVSQIAYAPTELRIEIKPELATETPAELAIGLTHRALVLPELSVTAQAGCAEGARATNLGRDAEPIVAAALDNAERLLVLMRSYPFQSSFLYQAEEFDWQDQRVGYQAGTIVAATRDQRGYSPGKTVNRDGTVNYFSTADLARPAFADRHCFWAAGADTLNGVEMLVVEFAPSSDLTTPDWAGRLTIDPESGQLHRSLAHMVNLDSLQHKMIAAQCLVAYGLVVATIVHETDANCVAVRSNRDRRTTVSKWEFIKLEFDKRRPGEPP